MKFTTEHATARVTRLAAALILCTAAAGAVQAQTASFAGPSMAQANKSAAFKGTNFEPNTPVTVMVKSPSGLEAGYSAVVDAQGQLVYAFTPTEDGVYALRVIAGKGKVLATSNIIARR